ncbi:hypothetical protein PMAYCL1PPCAC_31719, partial [Pristionchus mayeri]
TVYQTGSRVVLNREVLSADHAVSLEPLAAELLGGSVGCVGPLDGDTVVAKASQETAMRAASLGSRTPDPGSTPSLFMLVVLKAHPMRRAEELVTWNQKGYWGILREEDGEGVREGVRYLDVVGVLVIVGSVEDDLASGLGGDVSGRNGLGHVDDL